MGKITSNKNIIPIKKRFELLPQIKWWKCFGVPKYFSDDLAGKMMVRLCVLEWRLAGECVCVSVKWKERAGQKREEMWVKLSGWEWWVVGLGGGTRGPQNADLHFFFFLTHEMLQDEGKSKLRNNKLLS